MIALAFTTLLVLGSFQGATQPPHQSPPIPRQLPVYNFSLLMIGRTVDDADPADEQLGWGLEYDTYDPRVAFGWEIGVSRTSDDTSVSGGATFEATVVEVYTGARKTWGKPGSIHPYVGAGLAWVEADADLSGVGSEDDSSFGLYGHGGAYWTFGRHFNLGADLKALVGTDIEFGDADYFQAAVVVGYSL